MVDLRVRLGDWELDNPVIPASGTFGYGYTFTEFYDPNILGSLSFKGTTLCPRDGNETPRIAECKGGMLNSVGLQNPGVEKVLSEELPKLSKVFRKKLIANISGFSVDEFVACASALDKCGQVGIIEVNISCPNVHDGGMAFGKDAKCAARVTKAVKNAVKKPVFVKLSPNVSDITEIAVACEEAGADGLCLINTLLGMKIDLKTLKPVLANKRGGLSGPSLFPVAVRMIYDVFESVKIPIIGMGGVETAEDVVEMMAAGAAAVQVGAANLVNPYICRDIILNLPDVMEKYGIKRLSGIIGEAHR